MAAIAEEQREDCPREASLVTPLGQRRVVTATGYGAPRQLATFLDAGRRSAVTSASLKMLQSAPRSGVLASDPIGS